MGVEIVINPAPEETRVALIENQILTELYIDRKRDRGIVGNVYKDRVVKVLPGMQAAFVDIGVERAAFLYVADITTATDEDQPPSESEPPEVADEGEEADEGAQDREEPEDETAKAAPRRGRAHGPSKNS
jgi:ribonuclease G